ncbi:protein FAR-RED IMPAIRED RESPONSE 1-like [Argentina anserina]|uniref:protein FAR-RED IMPAIRED RESPONSE 1-like n=1 Tax=Argentina anserina TaxID=57926 RepID=UPI00217620A6|nr:protein FAR-RED IMPAIRED RESPONSE 1-like [Potentilla anserina]
MYGKTPKSILTDQDAAMAKALASQWPKTHHRLCIWHIYQNAAKHLKSVFEKFNDFAKDFSSIIYDYEDVEDFLIAWEKMLEKYNLQENKWLDRLFDLKEKWALVYGRQTFCADINTTQRNESMNNAIKRYVSYKYDLLRFFRHFQRLVDDRRYNESVADFKASQTSPSLSFPVKMLRNAAKVYTPTVFKWFQVELCKAHDCTLKLFSEIEPMHIYEVTAHGKHFHHIVTYDSAENTISCSCKKFEFAGILCSHALKVLSSNNVKTIPDQYILNRWRKDIRDQIPKVSCSKADYDDDDDEKAKIARRYKDLARLHTELATIATESDEAYEIATVAFHKTLADVKETLKKKKTNKEAPQVTSHVNNCAPEVITDDFDEHRVRGIKVKERIVRKEDSIRPKNALEKLLGNKRPRKDVDSSSRHQKEPELDHSTVTSTFVPATQDQGHTTQQMQLPTHPSVVDSISVPTSQDQMTEQEVIVAKSGMDNRVLPKPPHLLQIPLSTMHARMEQHMELTHRAQFPEIVDMEKLLE